MDSPKPLEKSFYCGFALLRKNFFGLILREDWAMMNCRADWKLG